MIELHLYGNQRIAGDKLNQKVIEADAESDAVDQGYLFGAFPRVRFLHS